MRWLLLLLLFCVPAEARVGGFLSGGAGGGSPSAPSVASIIPTPSSGTLTSGTVSFAVNFTANVTSSGGTPTMPLTTVPTQGVASCAPVTNAPTMTCTWSIGTNQSSNTLSTTSSGIVLNGASLVASSGGVAANLAGAINYGFPGLIINPTGTPSVVVGVSITPSSGLLTQTGGVGAGNTATVKVTFSTAETVNAVAPNVPTITLSNGTVCPYARGSTLFVIEFDCTILAGQDTSFSAVDVFLGTASSNAIALMGGSINNGGVPATLGGANGITFRNVQVDTTTPYFVATTGSGSTCSYASPCLPAGAQTKARGALKNIWLRGGTYSGLATCSFQTNTHNTVTGNICRTSADNGQIWFGYPGETPIFDGGSTNSSNGVFAAFESNGVTNNVFNNITIQHYSGGGWYDYSPINVTIQNSLVQNLFNVNAGAGGCAEPFDYWSNYTVRHITCQNVQGFGITANSGQTTRNGFSFVLTYDSNKVISSCTVVGDCGAIYGGWFPYGNTFTLPVGTTRITNNYIKDVGGVNTQGVGIYLDDFDSGVLAQGNIVTGIYTYGILIHAGSNNTFTNNIFDITQISIAAFTFNRTATCSGGPVPPNTPLLCNFVPFYIPTSTASGPPFNFGGTATNNQINKNIVYNGNPDAPPAFMGLYYGTSQLTPPTLGVGWYYTVPGTFSNAPFCWAGTTFDGGSSGICNPSGVLANPLFVNPTAQTAAGFQMQAGSTPLAGGFPQVSTTQGPL